MIHVCLKRIQQTFSPHGPLPPNANKYGKKGDVFFYKGIYCFFFYQTKKIEKCKKKAFFYCRVWSLFEDNCVFNYFFPKKSTINSPFLIFPHQDACAQPKNFPCKSQYPEFFTYDSHQDECEILMRKFTYRGTPPNQEGGGNMEFLQVGCVAPEKICL